MTHGQDARAEKLLKVVIIGAGISGLATAYGLKDMPGVQLRIFEKRREEECLQGGYPIHLALEGRQALQRLLSAEDYRKLLQSRSVFPACHDGVTILKSNGRIAWRMVQSPGQKCLMERQDLINILKDGLTASSLKQEKPKIDEVEMEQTWRKVLETTYDAEGLLGEGIDTWRNAASWIKQHPASSPRPTVDKRDTFGRSFQGRKEQEVDVELQGPAVGADAIRIEYGCAVKEINKTSEGCGLWDGQVASCDVLIGADGMFSTVRRTLYPPRAGIRDQGYQALAYTIINLRATTPAVRKWIGDEDSMNLICGKGWSAAFMALGNVPSPTTPTGTTEGPDLVGSGSEKADGSGGTYVAINIPHPQGTIRQALSLLPEAKTPGSFIDDLLNDPGLSGARAFPLWSSRKTCIGGQRALLIGDASHGMVPYCGAGASAGLADAVEVVELLHNHLIFGGDLDHLLGEFGEVQKNNNDPLIQQSRKVLWIAQGDNWAKRILRSVAFGALELGEKATKQRKQAENALGRWKGRPAP